MRYCLSDPSTNIVEHNENLKITKHGPLQEIYAPLKSPGVVKRIKKKNALIFGELVRTTTAKRKLLEEPEMDSNFHSV